MNKFDLMHKVLGSVLDKEQKLILVELILLSNDNWESWPTVARLCTIIGMKNEKNFKGINHYLSSYVATKKVGRQNHYVLNTPALAGLPQAEVVLKNTPSRAANTPATTENTPSVAANTPAVEGTDSTSNNTKKTTKENTASVASAPLAKPYSFKISKEVYPLVEQTVALACEDEGYKDTPSLEGSSVEVAVKKKFGDWSEAELSKAASAMMGWDEELNKTQEQVIERMKQTGKPYPISNPVDVALKYEKEAYVR